MPRCGADGRCACRPGWAGPECESLALGETPATGTVHGTNSSWTWGGSSVVDERGTHHLYFSFIEDGCGLLHYQTNSVVRHATAPSESGPWTVLSGPPALRPRPGHWDSGAIHGPTVLRDPKSGLYLLFFMGTTVNTPRPDCAADPAAAPMMNSSSRRVGLAWSRSVASGEEDWQRVAAADGPAEPLLPTTMTRTHSTRHARYFRRRFLHPIPLRLKAVPTHLHRCDSEPATRKVGQRRCEQCRSAGAGQWQCDARLPGGWRHDLCRRCWDWHGFRAVLVNSKSQCLRAPSLHSLLCHPPQLSVTSSVSALGTARMPANPVSMASCSVRRTVLSGTTISPIAFISSCT